jgi:hypothetical protein
MEIKLNRFKTAGNENEKSKCEDGNEIEEQAQVCEQHNTDMKLKRGWNHQQNSEFLLHENYTRSETQRSPPSLPHLIIGMKNSVFGLLLHLECENKIGKWQGAASTLVSYI